MRSGGELLGHGGDVKDGRGGDGYVVVQIGDAIAALVDDVSVLVDAQRTSRRIRPVPPLKDFIHLLGDVRWQSLLRPPA